MELTRRSFLKSAAVAAGATALAGASVAYADEAEEVAEEEEYTYADTIDWQAEYDVVVLGMGFAGMAAATAAADAGAEVLLCEKAPDGEAGGNSRVCGQMFAFGHGDVDACVQYYTALAAGRDVPEDMIQIIAEGVANMDTTLEEVYGLDSSLFTDQTETMSELCGYEAGANMSPEYPEFPGSESIQLWAAFETYGSSQLYVAQRTRLEEQYGDKIDVWFESPGLSLIQEPETGTIIGVVVERNGEQRNVRALNGVCVCTGGFECEAAMVQHYLGLIDYVVGGGKYNEGDGIKMCEAAGARLWHMNAYEGIGAKYYYSPDSFAYTYLPTGAYGSGATMTVGTWGRRFMDETRGARHGHLDLGNGIWENPEWPEKIFTVFDSSRMAIVEENGGFNEDFADYCGYFDTVAEAAEFIGCEEEYLQQTLDDFSFYIETERDYVANRDVERMTEFDGEGLGVIRMSPGILNTQGGPERNANAEIVDHDGVAIPHLYSAGEMGGITSCMYQGGTNVAECHIFGRIAGTNAAAEKDALPAYTARPKVECDPAHLGDETDLGAELEVEADEGQLVGTGTGMGGEFAVYVTVDENGAITSVTVGENSETEGIGSEAIEQLPDQFIGMSTAEEIDSVDGVSGATMTSNAIKEAIKEALGLE